MLSFRPTRTLTVAMYCLGIFGSDLQPPSAAIIATSNVPSSADTGQPTGSGVTLERPTLVPIPKQQTSGSKVIDHIPVSHEADLALTEEEHIHFARPDSREDKIATLQLFAQNSGFKIVSIDRFPHVLDNAECKDGSVSLRFNSEESFQQAVEQWHWVNTDEKNKIMLFTYSENCDLGFDRKDDLQLWDVDSFSHDNSTESITFSAKPTEVREAFQAWHFVANSRGLDPVTSPNRRVRRVDITKTASVNITSDFSKIGDRNLGFCWPDTVSAQDILLDNASTEDAAGCMYCETCETYGTFDFEFNIWADLTDIGATFKLTANNVGATLLARTDLYKPRLCSVPYRQEIWGFAPPGAGIYIRKILDIGPTLKFLLSTTMGDNTEPLSLSTGLNITIPDDSQVTIDLGGEANSGVSGWTPKVEVLGPSLSNGASITAKVGPDIELLFAAQILGQGVTVGFTWTPGKLDVKSKGIDEAPACGEPKAEEGANFDVGIGTGLDAFARVKFFGKRVNNTWPLASAEEDTTTTCQPILDPTRISRPTAMPSMVMDAFVPLNESFLDVLKGGISEGIASASAIADEVTSAVVSVATKAESAVVSVATEVGSAVVSVATDIESKVESVADAVETTVENVGEAIKDGFEDFFNIGR